MITKICNTCNITKKASEFHRAQAAKDGLQHNCKTCLQGIYAQKARELFEYKGGKCAHCNLRDLERPEIYDYHHTNPATKLHNVTAIMYHAEEKVHAEADKCILLCANCHRSEHERLRKEPKANEPEQEQEEEQQEQGQTIQYMLC